MVGNSFKLITNLNFKLLNQYVPVVDRVHGEHHPEFHEVKRIYELIVSKVNNEKTPDLDAEFKELREITNNYSVPEDVCETFRAVYKMLREIERAYRNV